jgi:hypothetical protein
MCRLLGEATVPRPPRGSRAASSNDPSTPAAPDVVDRTIDLALRRLGKEEIERPSLPRAISLVAALLLTIPFGLMFGVVMAMSLPYPPTDASVDPSLEWSPLGYAAGASRATTESGSISSTRRYDSTGLIRSAASQSQPPARASKGRRTLARRWDRLGIPSIPMGSTILVNENPILGGAAVTAWC